MQHLQFSDMLGTPESTVNILLVSISYLCHLLNVVSSPLQPKFNHPAIKAAKGKVMTSVSHMDSKGRSAALRKVTLLFITFMSHKWQRQWSQQCFLVLPSALPLCPEFCPVQWRLAHLTSKNWAEENDDRTHVLTMRKHQLLTWLTYQSAWTTASPENEAGVYF